MNSEQYIAEYRQGTMSLLAKAHSDSAATLFNEVMQTRPDFKWLRRPEIGSVMVRGRAGGGGESFNLGEMTVTRCALQLDSGQIGHAYVQGRRKSDAEVAALIDALMQTHIADELYQKVLQPLKAANDREKQQRAEKAAATKVDFFTLARGED